MYVCSFLLPMQMSRGNHEINSLSTVLEYDTTYISQSEGCITRGAAITIDLRNMSFLFVYICRCWAIPAMHRHYDLETFLGISDIVWLYIAGIAVILISRRPSSPITHCHMQRSESNTSYLDTKKVPFFYKIADMRRSSKWPLPPRNT